ncbi:MAG: hypothetical protein ABI205_07475, partial [Gemmatimonadaceae bacterium]
REHAKAVWHRRCKIVHEDPGLITAAGDTIRSTIAVLRELCVVGLQRDEQVIAQVKGLDLPPAFVKSLEEKLEARRQHRRGMRRGRPQ